MAFKEERLPEAEKLILRGIRISRSNPYYYNSLGKIRQAQGDFESASHAYRKALQLDALVHNARRGLGICLRTLGDLPGSASQLERLTRESPGDVDGQVELALTLRALGRLQEALDRYRIALRSKPGHQRAQRGLAEALLLMGNDTQGWPQYLRGLTEVQLPEPDPYTSPFTNKRVVIYGSEGVGDEIMSAGCMPDLVAQAARCMLHTDKRLAPLFQRSFPSVRCLGMQKIAGETVSIGAMDTHEIHLLTPMLLPYFPTSPDRAPGRPAYLIPDPAGLENWRERYRELGPGLKVGLSWRGGATPEVRFQRSIPLSSWVPVFDVPNTHFINLQYGDAAGEIDAVRERTGRTVHRWPRVDPLADLDDFAAQVAALDLVISVDNTTVHMAGALGVPVWTLVPFAPNWRWGLGRQDSPWYGSMKLLRQEQPGDWRAVLEEVRHCMIHEFTPGSQHSLLPSLD